MSYDVTIAYFIPAHEVKNLDNLCDLLSNEQGDKISRGEATRQAIKYFADHLPIEIEAMPRAAYKRGPLFPKKIPFQLPPELLEKVDKWTEDYSASRNQVIRHALMDYAKTKGLEWETAKPTVAVDPEWEKIIIDAETASLLAGVTAAVIHKYANMDKYKVFESDEIYFGKTKRYFSLADIVRFYEIPYDEVEELLKLGIERYKSKRYSEIRKF